MKKSFILQHYVDAAEGTKAAWNKPCLYFSWQELAGGVRRGLGCGRSMLLESHPPLPLLLSHTLPDQTRTIYQMDPCLALESRLPALPQLSMSPSHVVPVTPTEVNTDVKYKGV